VTWVCPSLNHQQLQLLCLLSSLILQKEMERRGVCVEVAAST
jgi:hypothetical protein